MTTGRARRGEALGYLWYLAFLLLQPVLGENSRAEWLVIGAAVAVFLPLYFRIQGEHGWRAVGIAWAIGALGLLVMPFNGGGGTFLIFAAALLGWHTTPRVALVSDAVLVGATLVEAVALDLPPWTWMVAVIGVVAVGVTAVRAAEMRRYHESLLQAQEDVEQMAAVAERERIARDLHDLLGHTLSVIVIKSELASRLAESDPRRAAEEIRDVERVSRAALTDVRSAVEGYRQRGLVSEVEQARQALTAAGIVFDAHVPAARLPVRHETALALALREAVTNVIRHSGASRCTASLELGPDAVTLTVQDNGRGGDVEEGFGIAGMRSRAAQVGGSVRVDGRGGLRVTVVVPHGTRTAVA